MLKKISCLFLLSILSVYPIYKNMTYGGGESTYERHIAWLNDNSSFYNPWQYRVFAPLVVEGMHQVLNKTIYIVIDHYYTPRSITTGHTTSGTFQQMFAHKELLKYNLTFLGIRFLQHLFIFGLFWQFIQYFVKNKTLAWAGIVLLSLLMGNAVFNSDLSFNTYFEVIFYLMACLLALSKKSIIWLFLLCIIAALNRETAILIPFIWLSTQLKTTNLLPIQQVTKQQWGIVTISLVLFIAALISTRVYFGWQNPVATQYTALKSNLLSVNSIYVIFELLGTVSILPLISILSFSKQPNVLKKWLLIIVPFWFVLHFGIAAAEESRLFLVPLVIVFLPTMLIYMEQQLVGSDSRTHG